jgi:GNAT superfamily N-acetyltransferase
MPDPRVTDLERAAARHWQAPDIQPLGDWLLRAAEGFTGRANSALPAGDPGVPLPEAVTAVEDWYRRRNLPPMIVLPRVLDRGSGPDPLEDLLAERSWVPRSGPAFVMTADIADIPASPGDVELSSEPDAAFIGQDGRAVACGRVSVARPENGAPWGALTAVEVDAACRRQGLGAAITSALAAAAASQGARRILLQVETSNAPARALYHRCGFRDSHRYHYMIAP